MEVPFGRIGLRWRAPRAPVRPGRRWDGALLLRSVLVVLGDTLHASPLHRNLCNASNSGGVGAGPHGLVEWPISWRAWLRLVRARDGCIGVWFGGAALWAGGVDLAVVAEVREGG